MKILSKTPRQAWGFNFLSLAGFLVISVVAAGRAIFAKGDFPFNLLLILSREVVDVAASGALQPYEIFRIL